MFLIEDDLTEKEAKKREVFWIKHFDSFNNGLNSTEGGDGVGTGKNNIRARAVVIKDIDTEEEYNFDWMGGAALWLRVDVCRISAVLSDKSKERQIYNADKTRRFAIKYKEDDSPWDLDVPLTKFLDNSVIAYDIYGKVFGRYDNKSLAAKAIGACSPHVHKSAEHGCWYVKGFIFEYEDEQRRACLPERKPLKTINKAQKVFTVVDRKRYEFSSKEAAKQHFGTHAKAIDKSVKTGCEDHLGLCWFRW
jgi:hypothetical protein